MQFKSIKKLACIFYVGAGLIASYSHAQIVLPADGVIGNGESDCTAMEFNINSSDKNYIGFGYSLLNFKNTRSWKPIGVIPVGYHINLATAELNDSPEVRANMGTALEAKLVAEVPLINRGKGDADSTFGFTEGTYVAIQFEGGVTGQSEFEATLKDQNVNATNEFKKTGSSFNISYGLVVVEKISQQESFRAQWKVTHYPNLQISQTDVDYKLKLKKIVFDLQAKSIADKTSSLNFGSTGFSVLVPIGNYTQIGPEISRFYANFSNTERAKSTCYGVTFKYGIDNNH